LKTFRKEDEMLKRIAIIALLGVSLASAKTNTYTFTLTDPTLAGKAQLQPGEYTLKVDASQAVLMDRKGHQIDATAKVETSDRKFDQTSISISATGGPAHIQWIELEGTKIKVVFE
jgi:hypothetical protein